MLTTGTQEPAYLRGTRCVIPFPIHDIVQRFPKTRHDSTISPASGREKRNKGLRFTIRMLVVAGGSTLRVSTIVAHLRSTTSANPGTRTGVKMLASHASL